MIHKSFLLPRGGLLRAGFKLRACRLSTSGYQNHFGFKPVDENERDELVKNVFSSVSKNYDLMNDLMSLGIHRIWKEQFVKMTTPTSKSALIDVASGTGDIIFKFSEHVNELYGSESSVSATMVEVNREMLDIAIKRADELAESLAIDLTIQEGNAEDLCSIPSDSMDIYTISYGLRNCTRIPKVLSEAYRVLKPGGKFMCLEFSVPNSGILPKIYDAYSFGVIPLIGSLVANNSSAYRYLVESIRKFPTRNELSQLMREAGFKTLGNGWTDLSFGISCIHIGYKM